MTSKTLIILAGAAAVVAAGAYVVSTGRSGGVSSAGVAGTALLFPELDAKGDSVTSITIRSGGNETLIRKLDKGRWGIASRDDYPAEVEKVQQLVQALAQAKVAETKTSKAELYDRLGVQDSDAAGSSSTLVILKAGETAVASLILGNAPTTRGDNPMQAPLPGVFARRAGEAQAVLLDKNIEAPKEPIGWMKTDVLSLEGQRVKSAVLRQAASAEKPGKDGEPPTPAQAAETLTLVKEKPDAPGFTVAGIPEGRMLRTPTAPAPIATVLSYVTIEDAAAAKVVEGLTPATDAEFRTFDGLVIAAKLYKKDAEHWLTLGASYEAPPKPEVPADAAGGDAKADAEEASSTEGKSTEATSAEVTSTEAKPTEAKPDPKAEAEKAYAETATRVQKEAADLNARLSAWAYRIPDFKARQIGTRLEELLVPVETTPAPAGAPAGTPPDAPAQPLIFPRPEGGAAPK